jgi:hypothetical protein
VDDLSFDLLAYPALSGEPKDLGTTLPARSEVLAQSRCHLDGALLDAAVALVFLRCSVNFGFTPCSLEGGKDRPLAR